MDLPAVSVVIVTWNAGDVLGACLDSLAHQRVEGGFETIVVDSGSTDRTAEVLAGHPEVVTISKAQNIGFSAGNNEAAARARGEVLFFLNSDTAVLDRHTLQTLARTLSHPDVGVAGPRLENPDGSLQPSCAALPGIGRALLVATGAHRLLPDRLRAWAAPDLWSHDRPHDTGWLMGAAVAVRAEVFRQAGGFWPTMYGEDMDLAHRLRRRGLRVRYEPAARVMHIGNHSLSRRWSDVERVARVTHAEVVFLRSHYAPARAATIRAILALGHGLRTLLHGLLGRRQAARVTWATARGYATGRLPRGLSPR